MYRLCWQPSSQEKKTITANPRTYFTSYLIDVVWDGRLWYNCTNLTNDCSRQRALTEWGKTGNRYVTIRQEMELPCAWWRICCGMRTKQRRQKANKDDMTYIKEQMSINRWPCVHQVHLVVQLGLSHNNGPWVSLVPIICMRVPDSCSICRACFYTITLKFVISYVIYK